MPLNVPVAGSNVPMADSNVYPWLAVMYSLLAVMYPLLAVMYLFPGSNVPVVLGTGGRHRVLQHGGGAASPKAGNQPGAWLPHQVQVPDTGEDSHQHL